jgi:sugar transferase EpsL
MKLKLIVVASSSRRTSQGYRLKRLIDLAVSSIALLFLFPLMAIVALLVRLRMGSPVLFSQDRAGIHGRTFRLYKFRTMTLERDSLGKLLSDDLRLTALGNFLRSASLDELPQLWNVLRGDMSLVGPRPLLVHYEQRYSEHQRRRSEVKPGITGWAQVNGRNEISWAQKFDLDVWYVDHCSLLLDLTILGKTAGHVLRRKAISQPGHATAVEFSGTPQDAQRG